MNKARINDENAFVLIDELHKSVEQQNFESDGVHVEAQSYFETDTDETLMTVSLCFFFLI